MGTGQVPWRSLHRGWPHPLDTAEIAYARPAVLGSPLRVSPNPGGHGRYTFSFAVPVTGPATLDIYNVAGRKVATLVSGNVKAGAHTIHWDGRSRDGRPVSRGIYFARLHTTRQTQAVKIVHLR